MLFNSHVFILAFLPIVLIGYFALAARAGQRPARWWLLAASLVFYGWWSLPYLGLLVVWIAANHLLGEHIAKLRLAQGPLASRPWAILGIIGNLAGLFYYKYATFLLDTVTALTGLEFAIGAVILPLAISFHTFQQIAYLADIQSGQRPGYSLPDYMLFVSFFPQLIAGPIVHHHELVPQLKAKEAYALNDERFAQGVAFFTMGLIKKLVLADPISGLAAPTFASAGVEAPGFADAWLAVIAFSLGLYFDFSAYSDMAVGLARMFNVQLPYNFNSPYKAGSIIEFWRRWHMTLSRFLRDYLYIPLGGNRKGGVRRSLNLMTTMLLGGLWHGAAWTFVIWGTLHGAFLLINHAWNSLRAAGRVAALGKIASHALTLTTVAFAWTFFAAPDFTAAWSMIQGMIGLQGWMGAAAQTAWAASPLGLGVGTFEAQHGAWAVLDWFAPITALAIALGVAAFAPNSQEIVDGRRFEVNEPPRFGRLRFHPTVRIGLLAGAAFLFSLNLLADVREFVYFQF